MQIHMNMNAVQPKLSDPSPSFPKIPARSLFQKPLTWLCSFLSWFDLWSWADTQAQPPHHLWEKASWKRWPLNSRWPHFLFIGRLLEQHYHGNLAPSEHKLSRSSEKQEGGLWGEVLLLIGPKSFSTSAKMSSHYCPAPSATFSWWQNIFFGFQEVIWKMLHLDKVNLNDSKAFIVTFCMNNEMLTPEGHHYHILFEAGLKTKLSGAGSVHKTAISWIVPKTSQTLLWLYFK